MPENKCLIEFPCDYPVKVMGKNTEDFEKTVYAIFKKHVHTLTESCIKTKASADNNYLAITIHFEAESKAQLDAIYQDLTDCPLVTLSL